jgi:hypothetical protein
MGRRRFDLDGRVIVIFVIVAVPFVAVGALLVVSLVRGALREALGTSLEQKALETKVLVERYVADQTLHLRMLSLQPDVRAAVARPAREPKPDELRTLEQAWASGRNPQATTTLLSSPLANHLRAIAEVQPAIKLLQVLDASGRLVASSARGGRTQQADAPWYHALAAEGSHGPYVGDVHKLPGSDQAYLEIAYPIYHASEGHWLGAVRALYDGADLYGVVAPVRVGKTGHAVLVRMQDGMVLASDNANEVLAQTFPGFEVLQAARRERGYWTMPEIRLKGPEGQKNVEPARIVAYAEVEQIPNVAWMTVIEQDMDEAMGPVADVTRYLWLHFLGAFGSFVALALYLSLKLKRPVIEEELHLHEEHVPQSMRRRRTDRTPAGEEA